MLIIIIIIVIIHGIVSINNIMNLLRQKILFFNHQALSNKISLNLNTDRKFVIDLEQKLRSRKFAKLLIPLLLNNDNRGRKY